MDTVDLPVMPPIEPMLAKAQAKGPDDDARRQALTELVTEKQWCHVTRTTEDREQGARWLTTFEGAGLDGVFAKRWILLWPERVAEVAYDQMEGSAHELGIPPARGGRFRHAVRFLRWRPDRDPRSCTFDRLDVPLNYYLYDVLEP